MAAVVWGRLIVTHRDNQLKMCNDFSAVEVGLMGCSWCCEARGADRFVCQVKRSEDSCAETPNWSRDRETMADASHSAEGHFNLFTLLSFSRYIVQ